MIVFNTYMYNNMTYRLTIDNKMENAIKSVYTKSVLNSHFQSVKSGFLPHTLAYTSILLTNWNWSSKKRIDGLKSPIRWRQTLCRRRLAESIPVLGKSAKLQSWNHVVCQVVILREWSISIAKCDSIQTLDVHYTVTILIP